MPISPTQNRTIQQAIITMRIIWGALIGGQLAFFMVIVSQLHNGEPAAQTMQEAMPLFVVAVVMLIMGVIIGWIVRRIVMKQAPDGTVTPRSWSMGNIIFLAFCEGPSFVGLVCVLMTKTLWPAIVVPAVAVAIQALSFPIGTNLRQDP